MKRFLRPGWLVLGLGLVVALSLVLVVVPGRGAQAATGAPAITVVLTQTSGTTKIDVSGVYSDPEGVCAISGKIVNIVVRDNNSTGTVRKTFTSTTTAGGSYGPTTTPGTPLGAGTYWVQSMVQGSLAQGYNNPPDLCPDVSNNNTITLT